jgi:hypothetical protein
MYQDGLLPDCYLHTIDEYAPTWENVKTLMTVQMCTEEETFTLCAQTSGHKASTSYPLSYTRNFLKDLLKETLERLILPSGYKRNTYFRRFIKTTILLT